jgi:hypothetical protein
MEDGVEIEITVCLCGSKSIVFPVDVGPGEARCAECGSADVSFSGPPSQRQPGESPLRAGDCVIDLTKVEWKYV